MGLRSGGEGKKEGKTDIGKERMTLELTLRVRGRVWTGQDGDGIGSLRMGRREGQG